MIAGRPSLSRRSLRSAINRRGRVFLTPTVIHGRTSLRACLIHHDLREEDLDCLLSEVRAAATELAANLTDHASQTEGPSR